MSAPTGSTTAAGPDTHAPASRGGRRFGPGEVVTLLPGAIHSVLNETDRVTVSLHASGRHLNHTARSPLDPERALEQPLVLRVS